MKGKTQFGSIKEEKELKLNLSFTWDINELKENLAWKWDCDISNSIL